METEKHRFTYCSDDGRAALLFDADFYKSNDKLESILRLPFLEELLGKPFYAFPAPNDGRIFVSSWLEAAPEFSDALLHGGEIILVNGTIRRVPLRELYAQCFDLAKLATDCSACKKKGSACLKTLLLRCAWKHKLSFTSNETQSFMDQIDVEYLDDLQKLNRHLLSLTDNSAWVYAAPHLTTDQALVQTQAADRRTILRDPYEHDFSCIAEVQERYSARSREAAKTRKAVKRCKSECILYPSCDWCTKPYRGAPTYCQNRDSLSYYSGKGPYTLDGIRERVTLPSIPRDIVSLFAYNGNLTTRVLGHRIQMQRMDFNCETVEFIPSSVKNTEFIHSFSIKDALKLCRIPYRSDGEYHKPCFMEPPRLMDDDELRLYSLCCLHNTTRGYSTQFGWTEPRVQGIEWYPGTKSFSVKHSGWSINPISEFHELLGAFGRQVVHHL